MTCTPFLRGEIARGAYHTARGHQQGRRATQTADPGRSRGEAREALRASERPQRNEGRRQRNEGRRRLEALAVLDPACEHRQGGLDRTRYSAITLIGYGIAVEQKISVSTLSKGYRRKQPENSDFRPFWKAVFPIKKERQDDRTRTQKRRNQLI